MKNSTILLLVFFFIMIFSTENYLNAVCLEIDRFLLTIRFFLAILCQKAFNEKFLFWELSKKKKFFILWTLFFRPSEKLFVSTGKFLHIEEAHFLPIGWFCEGVRMESVQFLGVNFPLSCPSLKPSLITPRNHINSKRKEPENEEKEIVSLINLETGVIFHFIIIN